MSNFHPFPIPLGSHTAIDFIDDQNGDVSLGQRSEHVDRMLFQLCYLWTAGAMLVMWTKFGKPRCNSGQTGSSKSPKAAVVAVVLKLIEVLSCHLLHPQGQRHGKSTNLAFCSISNRELLPGLVSEFCLKSLELRRRVCFV